ncbi:MAG TPA: TetR family transcriptional regulator [Micromonospora sp.]
MGEYRDTVRQRLRDTIIDAARAETITHGWDGVRMAGVAAGAGVSRQTVYNEFGNRARLAEALARREVDRFVADVRAILAEHGPEVRTGAYAAICHTLAEAAANPLVKAILTGGRGGADPLLPFLTTRSELVLTESSDMLLEWAATHLPGADPAALAFAADSIVRLVVSHIVLPRSPVEQTAHALAGLAVRLFADAAAE